MSRYKAQISEVINRNVVVSLALQQGYNAFLPVYDGGVDFILYHEGQNVVRKVQLKGRWMIDRKYEGRDIWMAFPINKAWYLMPHDTMVKQAKVDGLLQTRSWVEGCAYSRPHPSAAVIAQCEPYRFASIVEVAAEAANDDAT